MSTKNYSKNYISQEQDDHSTATKQKTLLQKNRTILAASGAAWTSVLAGFPFDSIKTRMQTHYYSSIMSCVRKTYAEEGTRGFFRGMIPPLVTVSIIKSVSFSVYEETKKNLLSAPKSNFRYDTLGSVMTVSSLSGGVSGAFIALLSCPLELVKIQRQLELVMLREMQHNINQSTTSVTTSTAIDQRQQASSWKAVKKIVQRKGIFGLWNGLACHSARDALGTSLYFGGYETMKRILSTTSSPFGNNSYISGPITHFLSGGFCGILSWLIVFPVDAVKTNLQKDILNPKPKYSGFVNCAITLVKKKGVRSLYRGLNVTLLRAFPIHSLNFLVYEQVLKSIPP